jgi:hypothetical protein
MKVISNMDFRVQEEQNLACLELKFKGFRQNSSKEKKGSKNSP